jgi:hypothetical protein
MRQCEYHGQWDNKSAVQTARADDQKADKVPAIICSPWKYLEEETNPNNILLQIIPGRA